MKEFYVRSDSGAMVPLDNLLAISQTTTPQVISHYNLFRSAEIDGSAAPGYSSGQAITAMDELAKKLPQGFSYSWTGLSLEELQAGGTSLLLVRIGNTGCLSDAFCTVRKLCVAFHRVAGRSNGSAGSVRSTVDSRAERRRVLPGGTGNACRTGEQKCDSDRRIRRTIARTRIATSGGHDPGGVDPAATNIDDIAGVHLGRCALSRCNGRRRERPSFGGHDGVRRHDHVHDSEPVLHSRAVPDHRGMAGAGEGFQASRNCLSKHGTPNRGGTVK